MSNENNNVKQIICEFREDGTSGFKVEGNVFDNRFMKVIRSAIEVLGDEWYFHVLDSINAEEKIKGFEIIIKA